VVLCSTSFAVAGKREIYLAAGGSDLLVLDHTTTGLVINRSMLEKYAELVESAGLTSRTLVQRDDRSMTLALQFLEPPNEGRPARWAPDDVIVYEPSQKFSGDYDLKQDDYLRNEKNRRLGQPYEGYLHRIDDENIVTYFSRIWDTPPARREEIKTELLPLAQKIIEAHPDDLHVRPILWDALLRNHLLAELATDLESHRARYETKATPWLRWHYHYTLDQLEGAKSSDSGRNAFDLIAAYGQKKVTLPEVLRRVPAILTLPEYRPHQDHVLMEWPNFLESQVLVKTVRVQATLSALLGRFDEAHQLLLATYRFGQMQNVRANGLERLIGIAERQISVAGLSIFALNADMPGSRLRTYLGQFLYLEQLSLPRTGYAFEDEIGEKPSSLFLQEHQTRQAVVNAKAALYVGAAAARIQFLETSRFPATPLDFQGVVQSGLPLDPFTSQPLRFFNAQQSFTVYSLGPDHQDQQAQVEYDPTNGTVSTGDISQLVRARPQYPFSPKGLRARSPADVYRAFPEGLPVDAFADTRTRGLGVSSTTPVRIYSFGPDTNQANAQPCDADNQRVPLPTVYLNSAPAITGCFGQPPRYIPNLPYDPTNGIVSAGDLYVDLPQ
jgi:hypothetical protein